MRVNFFLDPDGSAILTSQADALGVFLHEEESGLSCQFYPGEDAAIVARFLARCAPKNLAQTIAACVARGGQQVYRARGDRWRSVSRLTSKKLGTWGANSTAFHAVDAETEEIARGILKRQALEIMSSKDPDKIAAVCEWFRLGCPVSEILSNAAIPYSLEAWLGEKVGEYEKYLQEEKAKVVAEKTAEKRGRPAKPQRGF